MPTYGCHPVTLSSQAISAGPNINNPFMDEVACKLAYDAVTQAMKLRDNCTKVEKGLIAAQAARYAWPAPESRAKSARDWPGSKRIAQPWRPYATVAAWYLWRSLGDGVGL